LKIFIIIIVLFIFYKNVFAVKKNGSVKVLPLVNYSEFLKWYENTIGDEGSIEYKNQFFDYWLTNIKK